MYVWDCAYRHFTLEFVSYLICVLVTAKAVSAHNHCILSLDLIFFSFVDCSGFTSKIQGSLENPMHIQS